MVLSCFWVILAASRQVQTRKLVPDWIPTGQKVVPKNAKLVPDYVPAGSRLVFVEKHIFPPKKMSTYF